MQGLYFCLVIFIFGQAFSVSFWSTTSSWMENVTTFRVSTRNATIKKIFIYSIYMYTNHTMFQSVPNNIISTTVMTVSCFFYISYRHCSSGGLLHPYGSVLLCPIATLLSICLKAQKHRSLPIKIKKALWMVIVEQNVKCLSVMCNMKCVMM